MGKWPGLSPPPRPSIGTEGDIGVAGQTTERRGGKKRTIQQGGEEGVLCTAVKTAPIKRRGKKEKRASGPARRKEKEKLGPEKKKPARRKPFIRRSVGVRPLKILKVLGGAGQAREPTTKGEGRSPGGKWHGTVAHTRPTVGQGGETQNRNIKK